MEMASYWVHLSVDGGLLSDGKIVPMADRVYRLSEVPAAIQQLEQRRVYGKVSSLCNKACFSINFGNRQDVMLSTD
jgi:hypothetical protein